MLLDLQLEQRVIMNMTEKAIVGGFDAVHFEFFCKSV